MKQRKIVLLSCIAVLAIVCVIQAILAGRNPVKTLKFDESFDEITISKTGSDIQFTLDGSDWYIGKDDFKANQGDINNITKNIKEIKVLDTVGRLSNDEFNERWDLNSEKAITVTALKNGSAVRTIKIGKASSTGSQTYISVGNSKDVYLVSGNMNSVFSKSEDSYKSKAIFALQENGISSVQVNLPSSSWGIEKVAPVDGEITWGFTGSAEKSEADASKVSSWIRQIINLNATSWAADAKPLPSKKEASVEINGSEGKVTVDVYSEKNGDSVKYIATSNKTSHKFELSEGAAKRYIKAFDELKK